MAGTKIVQRLATIEECLACGAAHIVSISQAPGGPRTFRCPVDKVPVDMDNGVVMGETPSPQSEVFVEPY